MNARPFVLDRANGKMLGVCAGIADHFDIDVTIVRVAMIVAAALSFPIVPIAYVLLAFVADAGNRGKKPARRAATAKPARPDVEGTRERLRDIDARIQAIESEIVGSRDSALAREIEALR